MERFRNFDIHFVGLKNGITQIVYDVDSSFFKLFEKSPIHKGNLVIRLDFDKKDSFFILKFQVDGTVHIPCDRCNEYFDYELVFDFDIIVKFDEVKSNAKTEDEVIYISRGDSHINVAELLYDYILINIPIQVFHPNDAEGHPTCNPKVLEKLYGESENEKEDIDPRWAKLKQITDNN